MCQCHFPMPITKTVRLFKLAQAYLISLLIRVFQFTSHRKLFAMSLSGGQELLASKTEVRTCISAKTSCLFCPNFNL